VGGGWTDGLIDAYISPQLELLVGKGQVRDIVNLVEHHQILVAQSQRHIRGYLADLVAKVQLPEAQNLGNPMVGQLLLPIDIHPDKASGNGLLEGGANQEQADSMATQTQLLQLIATDHREVGSGRLLVTLHPGLVLVVDPQGRGAQVAEFTDYFRRGTTSPPEWLAGHSNGFFHCCFTAKRWAKHLNNFSVTFWVCLDQN